ncbi:MAG: hypothetical protein V4581_01125, partial [Bacteroidota bacterium]
LYPSKKQLLIMDEENKWGNVYQISRLVDTFFEDRDGQKVISLEYINNPVPKFRPLRKYYHGPTDAFTNVTFGEYLDCLRLFLDFSATGNLNLLYTIAAILYRPAKRFRWLRAATGDVRVPYNPNDVEKRADTLKYAPMGFIYGVYLLFASFQKYITTAVVPWAGRELDLSILFNDDGSGQLEAVPGIGMDGLVYALAESGEFGDKDKVRNVSLWEILIRLYDLKKKDLDYKLNDKSNTK